MNALAYFSPAFFVFTVHIAIEAFRVDVLERWINASPETLDFFVYTIDFIHVLLIATVVFYSLHFKNNHKFFKPMIYFTSTIFGIFMLIVMGVLGTDIIRGLISGSSFLVNTNNTTIPVYLIDLLRWLLIGSIGLYFVPLLFYWIFYKSIKPFC